MFEKIIEATFLVLLVYVIVANATGFSAAAKAVGGVYVDAINAFSQLGGKAA